MKGYLSAAVLSVMSSAIVQSAMADPPAATGEVRLIDPSHAGKDWLFDNGREFPGANGGLTVEPQGGHDGGPALVLRGDFTKGGGYVQAGRKLRAVHLHSLSVWVKYPGAEQLTLRLIDEAETCHQLRLRLKPSDSWQRLRFPAAEFFATMGGHRAADMVVNYEHWGKTKAAGWQGRLTAIYCLLGKNTGPTPTLKISDLVVTLGQASGPSAAAASAGPLVFRTIALDEVLQAGELDWKFDNGSEFKGATGTLTLVKDQPVPGRNALRLEGNFTKGGAYVQAMRRLPELTQRTLDRITFSARTSNCQALAVRLVDGTGQCFQRKGIALAADGQWHELTVRPSEFAGGEHWGGANDGRWHDPAQLIAILLGNRDDQRQPAVEFTQINAHAGSASASAASAAYREGFEKPDSLKTWEVVGAVTLAAEQPFAGRSTLKLDRPLAAVNEPIRAVGPTFAVQPGPWEIGCALRSALQSPDTSYRGVVMIEWLDTTGKVLEKIRVQEIAGTRPWQPFCSQHEAPRGTTAARFRVELEKTWGTMWVDELSMAAAQADIAEKRIERVVAVPARLGGIFLPDETPAYNVSVWAAKPLRSDELAVRATVVDYWGAEQGPAQNVTLLKSGFKDLAFQYETELKLTVAAMETGRFYYLHLDVPVRGQKPFRHTVGLARLVEAPARQLPPEAVPFTIRNWDNRIKDYFYLSDRLGFRMLGIWGGWKLKPPHKPEAPGVQFTQELGMKWVTGTPGAKVERGDQLWADPVMLRAGMTNFLKEYAKEGLAYICLGNEPHGGPEQVARNIAAYKALYEAVKDFDPAIKVIGTSVEPNEEYFRQGYHKYLDIYDFHTYESHTAVRKTIGQYQELMRKYNAVKPIFSTELGLNCQGLSRMTVARDMVKKLTGFFAGGGENASWFTIMYPDPKGIQGNTSGSAFQVFDCRYNAFNPKLDAVTLYNCVNGIGNKKFRAEKAYEDGTEAYLFSNAEGDCLLVAWNDKARADIGLRLAGVDAATLRLIDGASVPLETSGGMVTITASPEPVMLFFHSTSPQLPDRLAPAEIAMVSPVAVVKGKSGDLRLRGPGLTADQVTVSGPAGWKVTFRNAGPDMVAGVLRSPGETGAQAGRFVLRRQAAAAIVTEVELTGTFSAALAPLPAAADKPAGLSITLGNRGSEAVKVRWQAAIEGQFPMERGSFKLAAPEPSQAGFGEPAEGTVTLPAGGNQAVRLWLRNVDPQTLYRVAARVNDEEGHEMMFSRFMAGFVAVRKGTPTIDGDLSDDCWKKAHAAEINAERQFFPLGKNPKKWNGPDDCAAKIRFLWDEQFLHLGVSVRDDVFCGAKEDAELWNQDGLQLLVDPRRGGGEKIGYYDYSLGLGKKGAQMWCHSTVSARTALGEVKQARLAIRRTPAAGSADYEVAIPWASLEPFTPIAGANLGLALIVNDDDGQGRSFSGWFSGVHLKETDMLGDLILEE